MGQAGLGVRASGRHPRPIGALGERDKITCSLTPHNQGSPDATHLQPCPSGVGTPSRDSGTHPPGRAVGTLACPGEPALPTGPAPPARRAWGRLAAQPQPQALLCCGKLQSNSCSRSSQIPAHLISRCRHVLSSSQVAGELRPHLLGWVQMVPGLWSGPSPLRRHSLPSPELFPNPRTRLAGSDFPGWDSRTPTPWHQVPPGQTGWSQANITDCALFHPLPQRKGAWRMARGL